MYDGGSWGGLVAADEGGWGVIYSKLNRGLWQAVKKERIFFLQISVPTGLLPTPTPLFLETSKGVFPKIPLLGIF